MSHYTKIDALILKAIAEGRSPIHCGHVACEATLIGVLMGGRERFRVTEGRLKALRKAGSIHYVKASLRNKAGWQIKQPELTKDKARHCVNRAGL